VQDLVDALRDDEEVLIALQRIRDMHNPLLNSKEESK
jgi:hypothetical protein